MNAVHWLGGGERGRANVVHLDLYEEKNYCKEGRKERRKEGREGGRVGGSVNVNDMNAVLCQLLLRAILA